MQIQFRLGWIKSGSFSPKVFKSDGAYSLVNEYVNRISKFSSCEVVGLPSWILTRKPGGKVWACHRGDGARQFSSEQLAEQFNKLMNSGTKQLQVLIGGPDGFSKSELEELNPDVKWSFGPLTLPHELAAVLAVEQVYRAFTILNKMPYHVGH